MATVWILNHYATNMFFDHGGRHYEFAKQLIKKGYNVRIFCASTIHNSNINLIEDKRRYYEDSCDAIPYVFIKTRNYTGNSIRRILNMKDYYYGILSAAKHFEKPDVVLGSSVHPLACAAAIRLSKKYRCKNIVEIRDLWPESIVAYGVARKNNPLVKILYCLEKRLYTKADSIIFTMEGGRDYIIEKGWDKAHGGPVDLSKAYHINNGVDLEKFDYNREHYTFADPDLESDTIFKAVYCGSVREVNQLEKLLDVAEELGKRKSRAKILIFGDGNERDTLQKEADDRKIDRIAFKGNVDKKYIPFILSKCDLCLMHSAASSIAKYGMSLNKSFEYMASGKPIVSTLPNKYDVIAGNGCGITLDTYLPEAYADTIEYFAGIPRPEYERYCRNARKTAEKYNFKNLTEKLIEIIGND